MKRSLTSVLAGVSGAALFAVGALAQSGQMQPQTETEQQGQLQEEPAEMQEEPAQMQEEAAEAKEEAAEMQEEPAEMQERQQERQRVSAQRIDQVRQELIAAGVSERDLQKFDEQIRNYAAEVRDNQAIRSVARASIQANCVGDCLEETLKGLNEGIKRGLSPQQAASVVEEAINAEQERVGTEAKTERFGKEVRSRVKEQARAMERETR